MHLNTSYVVGNAFYQVSFHILQLSKMDTVFIELQQFLWTNSWQKLGMASCFSSYCLLYTINSFKLDKSMKQIYFLWTIYWFSTMGRILFYLFKYCRISRISKDRLRELPVLFFSFYESYFYWIYLQMLCHA